MKVNCVSREHYRLRTVLECAYSNSIRHGGALLAFFLGMAHNTYIRTFLHYIGIE
jgi:hypothetical protein